VADLEQKMYQVLKSEGLTAIEFLGVMAGHISWDQRLSDFEKPTYPLMLDSSGISYIYSGSPYDVFLIDKKGRLVTKEPDFSVERIKPTNKRIRELYVE
jgi:hypothetical protein